MSAAQSTVRTRRRGRARDWRLAVAALVAGAMTGLGLAPFNWWWLVPFGLAGLVLVCLASPARAGLWRGYVFGVGFNTVACHWVMIIDPPVGYGALIVFVAWLSLWQALIGVAIASTRRTPLWGGVGVAAWMAAEWACSRWPFGGYGWGRLAHTGVDTPLAGLYPLISAGGVSLIIVSIGFLLAWVLRPLAAALTSRTPMAGGTGQSDRPSLRHRLLAWVALPPWRRLRPAPVVALASLIAVGGLGGLAGRSYNPAPEPDQVTVAVVQGNVPGVGVDALGPRYTVENNHLAQNIFLAAQIRTGLAAQPDFVVWPENSTATDPTHDPKTAAIITRALDLVGAPMLVGAITDGPGEHERQTVGLWYDRSGQITARYAKRNLVPFGEWLPWRSFLLSVIPQLSIVGDQSVPGTTAGSLDVTVAGKNLALGDLICFEVAYDETFDQMMLGYQGSTPAQLTVVQTSNAMFTGSNQMYQQDHITRVRAMESRREILVATTNSLAGLIDTHGQVVYEAELRTSDVQVFTVPRRSAITWALAHRAWFDLAGLVLPLLAAAGAWLVSRRRGPAALRADSGPSEPSVTGRP